MFGVAMLMLSSKVNTVFAVVELLAISGLSSILSSATAPIFNLFGIPSELTEFLISIVLYVY